MKKKYSTAVLLALTTIVAATLYPNSHEEPKVVVAPKEHPELKNYLQRDLIQGFKQHFSRKDITVEFDFLQSSTIQSGIESPKYYVWVLIKDVLGNDVIKGAARVTAAENSKYELTHFISDVNIKKHPADLGYIFPAPLAKGIIQRAQATK